MNLFEQSTLSSARTSPMLPVLNDSFGSRLEAISWDQVEATLATNTHASLPRLLTSAECGRLMHLYAEASLFRSRVVMERYAFGRGEYKYFGYPLPDIVGELRAGLYEYLAPIANRWHQAMRMDERFPPTHEEFVAICNLAGQRRPTPLMLRYGQDDYCCLHQDLYGDHVFPFQVVFLLSKPGTDFMGGELMLAETAPKKPGTVDVVQLEEGEAVIIPVNCRPVSGVRGAYRANVRHGVSKLRAGTRNTLGIIFHEAK